MRKFALLVILMAGTLIQCGCQQLARGAAEEPYRKAMFEGRMSPSEFKEKQEEIRRASEGKN
jgi:hypothetical protein